jgi:hypothetical protein
MILPNDATPKPDEIFGKDRMLKSVLLYVLLIGSLIVFVVAGCQRRFKGESG